MNRIDHITAANRVQNTQKLTLVEYTMIAVIIVLLVLLGNLIMDTVEYRHQTAAMIEQIRDTIRAGHEICRTSVVDGVRVEHCMRKDSR